MKERPILFSGEMVKAILDGKKTQTRRVIKFGRHTKASEYPADVGKPEYIPRPDMEKLGVFQFGCDCGDCRSNNTHCFVLNCPYGVPGDRLWVRETFVIEDTYDYGPPDPLPTDRPHKKMEIGEGDVAYQIPHYRATEPEPHIVPADREDGFDDRTAWTPCIFMPRWASRITLEIKAVRVERVQEITPDDVIAEGIDLMGKLPHPALLGPDAKSVDKLPKTIGDYWFKELWDSINAKRGYGWETNPWCWVIHFARKEE